MPTSVMAPKARVVQQRSGRTEVMVAESPSPRSCVPSCGEEGGRERDPSERDELTALGVARVARAR